MPTRTETPNQLVKRFDAAYLALIKEYRATRADVDQRRNVTEIEMILELACYRGAQWPDVSRWIDRSRQLVSKRMAPIMAKRGLTFGREVNNPNPQGPKGRPYFDWHTDDIVDELTKSAKVQMPRVVDLGVFRCRILPLALRITTDYPSEWPAQRLARHAMALVEGGGLTAFQTLLIDALREERKRQGLPPRPAMRYNPDHVTVYRAVCSDCGRASAKNSRFFSDGEKRDAWAREHGNETGHVHFTLDKRTGPPESQPQTVL